MRPFNVYMVIYLLSSSYCCSENIELTVNFMSEKDIATIFFCRAKLSSAIAKPPNALPQSSCATTS